MNKATSRREYGSPEHSGQGDEHQPTRAVLLINLGSPDAPEPGALREYLREFLSDPAVIQLPRLMGWFNKPLGRMIARFRCKTSAAMYRSVWTDNGSPLISIANAQVAALQEIMPRGWRVYPAMRYGNPSIPDVLRRIEADGIQEVVVVPMYPQYSGPTTGTAMKVVYDYLSREDRMLQVTTRLCWYNDHSYVSAQAQLLEEYAKKHGLTPDNTYLLFSAHGLPVSYVRKGDPYPEHIAETVTLVADRMGWPEHRMSLAFQSRFGPAKWLQPYTDVVLKELSETTEKRILVCPISFTVDCLETLEEIDERYRELVEETGGELFLCPALNTFKPFINGLKHLVLQGCSPINGKKKTVNGVGNTGRHGGEDTFDTKTLIMVGASTAGQIESGREIGLHYTDGATLKKLKRPACVVPQLLREVVEAAGLEEALLWNTCHRFELYGWVKPGTKHEGFEQAATKIREIFLADRSIDPAELNMLCGKEAQPAADGLGSEQRAAGRARRVAAVARRPEARGAGGHGRPTRSRARASRGQQRRSASRQDQVEFVQPGLCSDRVAVRRGPRPARLAELQGDGHGRFHDVGRGAQHARRPLRHTEQPAHARVPRAQKRQPPQGAAQGNPQRQARPRPEVRGGDRGPGHRVGGHRHLRYRSRGTDSRRRAAARRPG